MIPRKVTEHLKRKGISPGELGDTKSLVVGNAKILTIIIGHNANVEWTHVDAWRSVKKREGLLVLRARDKLQRFPAEHKRVRVSGHGGSFTGFAAIYYFLLVLFDFTTFYWFSYGCV